MAGSASGATALALSTSLQFGVHDSMELYMAAEGVAMEEGGVQHA